MVESSAKKFRASSHLASHNVALILIYCSCIPPGEMLSSRLETMKNYVRSNRGELSIINQN